MTRSKTGKLLIYHKHTKFMQFAGFCSNFAFRKFLVFPKNRPLLCFPQEWKPFVVVRWQRVTGGWAGKYPTAAQRAVSG